MRDFTQKICCLEIYLIRHRKQVMWIIDAKRKINEIKVDHKIGWNL